MNKPILQDASKDKSHRLRDLFIILGFYFTIFGVGNLIVSSSFETEEGKFYARALVRCVTSALLIFLCIRQIRLNLEDLKKMVGQPGFRKVLLAIGIGFVLFLQFLGVEGFKGWFLSNMGIQLSPSQIFFQPDKDLYWRVPDTVFLIDMLIASITAPIAEEFFFRGLLLPSLTHRFSVHRAVILSSLIFILAHGQNPYYVHTLIFSICLSYFYIAFQSLGFCIVAHSAYNFIALNSEFFLSSWISRSQNRMDFTHLSHPQLILFLTSALILTYIFYRYRLLINKEILKRSK